LLLLQQNGKYEALHILTCLSRVDIEARPNGKCGRVLGNSMHHFRTHSCEQHCRVVPSYIFSVAICLDFSCAEFRRQGEWHNTRMFIFQMNWLVVLRFKVCENSIFMVQQHA
jgi:hypothetical protein